MAKNKVQIDVKVDDKGTTKKVALDSKKAAKGLDETGKSARTADRNLKGAAKASSNTTKNFSKMAQGTGGLVAAYATLAASLFAISAAFQFLKRAGDLKALESAQAQYTSKTGLNMKLLTSRIQEASGGIISFQEASQAAAIGMAAGLTPDQLERLGSAAKNAAAALGRDTADAFQRLTRGAIKAEPELLDELGIIIRLDKATKDYKQALDITGRELTTFEKTQAVVNATLRQAEEKFDDVGGNVNDVARLGKAFDDLIKTIQRGIVGPAEFIADVFTKNIFALSAAFALLGVNITKAMAPTVHMQDLSKMAEDARKRVSGAALTGSAAGAKAAKGDFSSMKTLEKAAGADKSTVLNVANMSKASRVQIKKDLKIIQADHARTMAANSRGFKKYALTVKANLKMMQAQHGVVMGTMKAGLGGLAKFASKAMNAIAILGMITLAVSLGKELLNLLKSKELKQMEDRAEKMKNRFQEQTDAVKETLETIDYAGDAMGRLVQRTNMFNQLSTKGSTRLLDSFQGLDAGELFRKTKSSQRTKSESGQMVRETILTAVEDSEARDTAQAALKTSLGEGGPMESFITSMQLSSKIAADAGRSTTAFDTKVLALKTSLGKLAAVDLETTDGVATYNTELENSRTLLAEVLSGHDNLSASLNAESTAVKSLNSVYEKYQQLQTSIKGGLGTGFKASNVLKDAGGAIAGMSSRGGSDLLSNFLSAEDIAVYSAMLGVSAKEMGAMTKDAAIEGFTSKGAGLESEALALARGPGDANKALAEGMQAKLPFLREEAQHKKQITDLDRQLLQIQHDKNIAAALNTKQGEETVARLTAETGALQAQRDLLKENFSEMGRLANAVGSSLEQGLGKAIEGLVSGTMTMKEAFVSMAKSVVSSITQVIAKLLAQKLIMSTLGSTTFGNWLGLGARTGGVFSDGKAVPGYATGGIAKGSTSGYPVMMHGTEAVVPLPNGKSIPVEMNGGGSQQNSIVVNVSSDGSTQTQESSGPDMENLGKAVAVAVQKELQNQKRSGGILSPYGVA